ncbi:MAG: hypothetical protein JSS99_01730 [Actinobacteria bacterium]|nr:hypothetical protein [Actinomycetota bacterium]
MSVGGRSNGGGTALDSARLRELLTLALARMPVPDGSEAVLEGSLAEGFGNVASDVDFLVLADGDASYAGTPTVLFADGRRIEVRLRSTGEVAADRDALWRLAARGPGAAARIPDDLLNRCQRLARALPLGDGALAARVQAALPLDELGEIASASFAHRARQAGRLAVALLTLADEAGAAMAAETALTFGAKAWAALRGETYVDAKWLPEQLRRVAARGGADAATAQRCGALARRPAAAAQAGAYVRAVLELLPGLGVAGCPLAPERVSLRRRPGVTTWPIAGRLHVLRDGREAFVLGERAARAWRAVVFERPLPAVLERAPEAGPSIAAFHRLGLVRLAWRGGGTIAGAPATTPPPGAARPALTLGGATPDADAGEVTLVPLPARRFAAAGMALVWANVMVENAREDAVGALDAGQWGVLAVVARRMLDWAARSLLSAYGVDPLPAYGEACARLAELPGLDRRLADDARALDARLAAHDAASGRAALADAEALVARLRAPLGAADFPRSFADAAGWRTTLETFYDWVRIGAHLDSALPLDELRDVLLSVEQRHARV